MLAFEGLEPAAGAALLTVAGHGLAGREDGHPAPAPDALDDRDWRSLVRVVRVERMTGLLDRAVADGAVRATDEQAADAEGAAAHALRNVLHLERRLVLVAELLGRGPVPFLVLKGPAVARLDEADPALRHYADVDILVRSGDVAGAVSALGALGYGRDLPERHAGFDRRFAKEVSLADGARSELDLHRTLVLGAFGHRIDPVALWEATDRIRLAGSDVATLDAEGRFVHACVTAALGDERPRLVALRDVAVISTAHRLDAARLARIVPPGRGAAVVARAVAICRATLGEVVGPSALAFAAACEPSRWERVALRAYRAQGGSNTLELLSGALGVQGADRAGYLRGLLVPDAGYLAARRRSGRPEEWSTGLREVMARRGRRSGEDTDRG